MHAGQHIQNARGYIRWEDREIKSKRGSSHTTPRYAFRSECLDFYKIMPRLHAFKGKLTVSMVLEEKKRKWKKMSSLRWLSITKISNLSRYCRARQQNLPAHNRSCSQKATTLELVITSTCEHASAPALQLSPCFRH
jgi:hypothetical protein